MIYLLDTNACIRYLNGRGIALLERMQGTVASEIAVCSVVRLELFYGALRSQKISASTGRPLVSRRNSVESIARP